MNLLENLKICWFRRLRVQNGFKTMMLNVGSSLRLKNYVIKFTNSTIPFCLK